MPEIEPILERTSVSPERPVEVLDVRELGPPEPLSRTLELLAELSPEAVVVQLNDRAPQFLFPKLEERGYGFETFETAECTVTVIYRPEDGSPETEGEP